MFAHASIIHNLNLGINIITMHKRLISAALAAFMISGASAVSPFGTPSSAAYLTRGTEMLADKNFVGAADQLSEALRLNPDIPQKEKAAFEYAVARLHANDRHASDLLTGFIREYPASPLRHYAGAALAALYYDQKKWNEALDIYNTLEPDVFDRTTAASMLYHRGFCRIISEDYAGASADFGILSANKDYANNARFFQAYIAYAQKDYSNAARLFRSVAPQTDGPTRMTDFYLSQIHYLDGDYNRAASAADNALKVPDIPDSFRAEAERIAGESAYQLGNDRNAVSHLRKYVSLTSDPLPSALYILGISEYRSGDYREAISTLTSVAKEDNVIGQSANLFIGQSSAKLGNYTSAILAFDNAYKMGFDEKVRETALYNYAVAKSEGGKIPFGSSVRAFETFLKQYPESPYAPEVEEYIISGYMTDNNYAAALRSIDAIKKPSAAVLRAKQQVLYTIGTKDLASGDAVGALNRFRQAKALGDINPEVYPELDLWIAESLYKGKAYPAAAASYKDYIRNNPRGTNVSAANYGLGYAEFGEKNFSDAYSAFDAFLSKPANASANMRADAVNRMADCRYYAGEFDKAASLYDKAYDISPASGDYALFQKAMMKGLRRQHNEKISGMADMMKRFPTSSLIPQALLETGDAYNEIGNTQSVISTYTELSTRFPETSQGRQGQLLLAITYLNNDRTNDAAETYREIIRSYPTSEEARTAADDLKRIYADRGTLPEFVSFMNSIPNAPEINPSEIDRLTFANAEKIYLTKGDISAISRYMADYPKGENLPAALLYSAEEAHKKGKSDESLRFANRLISEYPHWQGTDDATLIKASAETDLDMLPEALRTYERLESSASSALAVNKARLGVMKVARDLGDGEKALAAADRLLASSALESGEREEILFSRGVALDMTGHADEAVAQWKELTGNTDNLYGTKAAFYLANHYFNAADLKNARKYAELLIDANTPHNYWLARTFILLSDINRAEGNEFEADEYLKSLRQNYPGSDVDIFTMIEQRLNKEQ